MFHRRIPCGLCLVLTSSWIPAYGVFRHRLTHVEDSVDSIHAGKDGRNHILFLMCDQMDGRIFDENSYQYHPPMKNLRKLAKSGVNFQKSYTGSPLCVPSRSSMFTGRHTSQIGVFSNAGGIATVHNPDTADQLCSASGECDTFKQMQNVNGTFVDVLSDAGYNVTMVGKIHAGAGLSDRFNPSKKFDDDTCYAQKTWAVASEFGREWSRESGLAQDELTPSPRSALLPRDANAFDVHGDFPKVDFPGKYNDLVTMELCRDNIRNGIFDTSHPQFLYCSFYMPHDPHATNYTYYNRVDLRNDWVNLDVPSSGHPAEEYSNNVRGWIHDGKALGDFRHVYFSQCEHLDSLVGQILDALDATGARKNTYIVFVSDHGEFAGERGLTGKQSLYEPAMRVPIIITGPDVAPHKNAFSMLTSLHDIYPTILDMAGGLEPRGGGIVGESLLPIAKGAPRKKSYVIGEYHAEYSGTGEYMVRKGDYKLIHYGAPQVGGSQWPPRLYDLSKDPHERNDIASQQKDTVWALQSILWSELDVKGGDAAKKKFDKHMYEKYVYNKEGGGYWGCGKFLQHTLYETSDDSKRVAMAERFQKWFDKGCAQ